MIYFSLILIRYIFMQLTISFKSSLYIIDIFPTLIDLFNRYHLSYVSYLNKRSDKIPMK